jgi:hypothetical protein
MANLSDNLKNTLPFEKKTSIATITSNHNASDNETIFVNTASGAFTVTLPSSPIQGSKIKILDIASNATTNNITIIGNGNLVGASSAYKISVVDSSLDLLFINNTKGWLIENSYIPIDLPGKPTSASVVNVGTSRAYNNGAATVTFIAPDSGDVPDYYEVVSSPGTISASGGFSPVTINGLQSNTQYSFAVRSKNAAGYSAFSTSSNTITATTVPNAPTVSTVTSSFESASVAFSANETGGSSITQYTVTSNPGSISANGASSPINVTGLTAGTSYLFTVTAANQNGNSISSAQSASAMPFNSTGGNTVTTSGGYRTHIFTSSGTFAFAGATRTAQYLSIAGGGGGGTGSYGGGGGAGGFLENLAYQLVPGSYVVTVGAGGGANANGTNSSIETIATSIGGGRGAVYQGQGSTSGGSGGGGARDSSGGAAGTAGQGNSGGGNVYLANAAGGGGGAGGGGQTGGGNSSGAGGVGAYSSLSGTNTYYATGGNGGNTGASLGQNTGAGGGGNNSGMNGIVIIRYAI